MEYADVIWNNCTQYESNELGQIQNKAASIVSGATKLFSINSHLTETGWETLSARRNKHTLTLLYKIRNNFYPEYLSSLVPTNAGLTVGYSVRNANDINTVNASTQLYFNSALLSVIRAWNELPSHVQDSHTLLTFKYHLNSIISSPPSHYYTENRPSQICHPRIRTRCSALNQQLLVFSKNIIPSPLCACGGIDNTRHFLLECAF